MTPGHGSDGSLQVRDLRLDPRARRVRNAGQPVQLAPVEFELLLSLMSSAGQVLSRARLERRLRSTGRMTHGAALTVHIHHLRRKIGADMIFTVRGAGYMLPMDGVWTCTP
jgi:DNA-binding response OmpR family regulator